MFRAPEHLLALLSNVSREFLYLDNPTAGPWHTDAEKVSVFRNFSTTEQELRQIQGTQEVLHNHAKKWMWTNPQIP